MACYWSLFFTCCGVVIIIIGVILGWYVFPIEIKRQVKDNVILKNGTEQYQRWEELPVPLEFKVYIFHVLNPDEVQNGGTIHVKEIGPYVYNQKRKKYDITYNPDDDTYTYLQDQIFTFDADASGELTENDVITVLNVPMNAIMQTAEADEEESLTDSLLTKMFNGATTLFVDVTVRDLLFDGYHFCKKKLSTPIVTIACKKVMQKENKPKELVQVGNQIIFSFFRHKQYGVLDGHYSVKSGITNYKEVGCISKWENKEYTNFWEGKNSTCDRVIGTDSTIFPPLLDKTVNQTIYSTDICRAMNVTYVDSTVYKGINAYRYELLEDELREANPDLDNQCYCIKKSLGINRPDQCLLSGALDLFNCHGAPIVLTYPHFYLADKQYLKTIKGLTPSHENHVTFAELEPYTGTPLKGSKKVQFNMFIRPVPKMERTEKLKHALVPVLWLDEGTALPDDYIEMLNDQLFNVLNLLEYIKWGVIGLGILITVVSFIIFIWKYNSNKSNETV